MNEITHALSKIQLVWKDSSLAYLACGVDEADHLRVDTGHYNLVVPLVENMEVLGIMMDNKATTSTALEHRLYKARSTFYQDKVFYRCRRISLKEKFDRYCSRVQSAALHCCSGWSWTKETAGRLRRFESGLLTQMMGKWKRRDQT